MQPQQMKERAMTVFLLVLTVLAVFAVGRAVYGWATKPAPYPPVNVRLLK